MVRANPVNSRRGTRGARKLPSRKLVNWLGIARMFAAVAVLAGAFGALAWKWQELTYWPVRTLSISGSMQNTNEQEIRAQLLPFMDQGLIGIPLDEVRDALRQLPWIDDVRVTRSWPDALEIQVIEQQAVARWGQGQLLNYRGEVFSPSSVEAYSSLTGLFGPLGSEQDVMASYVALNSVLAQRQMVLHELHKDERGAWRATLANGIELKFGSSELALRIKRFIAVYDQQLALYLDNIATVDLRYNDGLAVGWKTPLDEFIGAQENVVDQRG